MAIHKQGLDYFPLSVDFFQRQGGRALAAKYGADGPAAYLFLLCEIYRVGYALCFDEDTLRAFGVEIKIPYERFLEILGFMASRGLVDSRLYARGYLSSREIQCTWQEALRGRAERRTVLAERKTWLLSAEETESYVRFNGEEWRPPVESGVAEVTVTSSELGGQGSNEGRARTIREPGFPGERQGFLCPKIPRRKENKTEGEGKRQKEKYNEGWGGGERTLSMPRAGAREGEAGDCGREGDLTGLTDEELRLLGLRLDAEAATPATEEDIAEGGAFWSWAARKEAYSREVARRKDCTREKWRGGKSGYLKSYEEVMDGWGLSPGVRQGVRAMLRHCQINGQSYTNERLDDLCARLLDLPDDAARAEALQTALDSGRFMIC